MIADLVFGTWQLPQFCNVALREPQDEIGVWLGDRDVTTDHVAACMRPFTIGVALPASEPPPERASLRFRERRHRRVLGAIALRRTRTMPLGDRSLHLFEVRGSSNACLPRRRLWRRYAHDAYRRWRASKRSTAVQMVTRDAHAHFVFYICPRPVFLVSCRDDEGGNLFPMDLVGPLGDQHFALALHSTAPAGLLERARRVALSSIPWERTGMAYALAENHKRSSIAWEELPFPTVPSATFGLPVPDLALRVRELAIESVSRLGSHTLFLARVVSDQHRKDGLQMFQLHGFYEAWRRRSTSSM